MISRELTRKVMADASNVSIACNITYLKTAVQFSKGKPNREIRYFIPNISYNLKECLKHVPFWINSVILVHHGQCGGGSF